MVATLTLDLKDSRKYKDKERALVQSYLILLTEAFNQIFKKSILRELRFTGGDELQGLFSDPECAFLCLRLFQRMLFSIPFHAGIGIGEWSTIIEDKDTFYQDGTAFQRARTAIDKAKKDSENTALICSETQKDPIFNALLNCCFLLINKNTQYQNELGLILECSFPIQPYEKLDLNTLLKLPVIMKKHAPAYVMNQSSENDSFTDKNNQNINGENYKQISPLLKLCKPIPIFTSSDSSLDTLVYQNSHPFGAASKLAEFIDLKRQNIDSALRKSDIYTERSLAIALKNVLHSFASDITYAKEADK